MGCAAGVVAGKMINDKLDERYINNLTKDVSEDFGEKLKDPVIEED